MKNQSYFEKLIVLAGVGIYKKNDYLWNQFILELNDQNKIHFIFSDLSISYGVKAKISHIILMDSINESYGISTLI